MPNFNQKAVTETLNERELEILKLIGLGRSNGEIANSLNIALETVKWYNRRIFEKLGASNRTEAAARAQEMGLLENDELKISLAPEVNLPAAIRAFVGREAELAKLEQLITEGRSRLITILAPGGMGKTSLAVETARKFVKQFPNGVYFVPLAHIKAAEQTISAIAEQMGIQFFKTDSPHQELLSYFREKRLLLVLDNFEHLLDSADFVREVLEIAPDVQILISSREKLSLQDEAVFTLRGFELVDWDSTEDAFASDAVQVFIQAAKLSRSDFSLKEADLPQMARICRLVQGMPLGLILAAAWVDILSLAEIADEIALNLDFLESNSRDIPDRQRSIRAVFDHAWRRLSQEEQSSFMKLAVFRGGFTRLAAQSITGASLRNLQSLASKALIVKMSAERFEIHELLRQYAEMKLQESGAGDACRDAASVYFLKVLAEREAEIKGKRQFETITEIAADFENLREAWFRALEIKNIALLNLVLEAMTWFCLYNSNFRESASLFQTTIERLNTADDLSLLPLWGKLVLRLLRMERWRTGAYQFRADAEELMQKCLLIAQREEDELEIAHCYYALADYEETIFGVAKAREYFSYALPMYEKLGDLFHLAWAVHFYGYSFWGNPEEESKCYLQALELRERIGDDFGAASSLSNLCEIAWTNGQLRDAEYYLAQSNKVILRVNLISAWNHCYAALIPLLRGDFTRAEQLAEESFAITEKANYSLGADCSLVIIGLTAVLEGNYARGKPICERCLPKNDKPHTLNLAFLGLVIAACSEGEIEEARKQLAVLWQLQDKYERLLYIFVAPIAAFIYYHKQEFVLAAKMAGAAEHLYPEASWHQQWKPFTRLKSELAAKLGDENYQAAVKSGEKFSAKQIFIDLQLLVSTQD